MKYFRNIAGVLSALAVIFMYSGDLYAEYEFDDLLGPSGISYQWMVINDFGDTFGNSYTTSIDISGDVLSNGEVNLRVMNGRSATTITDRSPHTFFLVVADSRGHFGINFRSPVLDGDVATPEPRLSTIANENATPYYNTREALGQTQGRDSNGNIYDSLWRAFDFELQRGRGAGYDTVIQSLYFQQNPSDRPSQGITRPFVISNVYPGTASDKPLVFRMILREDSLSQGNIVAYDREEWRVEAPMDTMGSQWVFVPVNDLNVENRVIDNYYLTTEVSNNSSVRYAARPYDSYGDWEFPSYWKFDFARPQGMTNVERSFYLASTSHIAPGLVTGYQRKYNINEQYKTPLHVFPVDDLRGTGDYDIRLNHRIIFGKPLGNKVVHPASAGNFNLFEVTAYYPQPASGRTFYNNVAAVMRPNDERLIKNVYAPESALFNDTAIDYDYMVNVPGDALEHFTITQEIPSEFRNTGTEGLLPLHITFNIPVTMIDDRAWWNMMVEQSRAKSNIAREFAQRYSIYLQTDTEGRDNPWNLMQELIDRNCYTEQVKVFIDEDRGQRTTDNSQGLITVSFIVMLMDGTRDGTRPVLNMVPDVSSSQNNQYIVVRDGHLDNKWNMTFFITRNDYSTNPSRDDNVASIGAEGSSGGCNSGVGMVLAALFLLKRREGR